MEYRCEKKIRDLSEDNRLSKQEEKAIRDRCQKFLLSLYKQLKQRLPDNIKIHEKISLLSVGNVLHPNKEPIASLMEFLRTPEEIISAVENQYKTIHLTSWKNTIVTEQFWGEVFQHKDASEENPFQELSEFVISTLVLPHSNAEVERIFSSTNNVKKQTQKQNGK